MKNLLFLLLFGTLFCSCDNQPAEDTDETDADTTQISSNETVNISGVEQVWATDTMMLTSESVLYDEDNQRLFVSNIVGNPTEKDNVGYISLVDLEGNIIESYWITDLNAPKGMAISNGKLYVTDIDKLVEIDLETVVTSQEWQIDTAQFLNDVYAAPDGTVYFSDSNTNTIYALKDGSVTTFLNSSSLNGPNGIYVDGNTMMITTMNGGEVLQVNMDDKSIKTLATGIGAGDGIVPVGDGRYLASSWNGQVFLVDNEGNTTTLLDTTGENINSADIEYIPERNMLLVPTFNDNRVVAYRLK